MSIKTRYLLVIASVFCLALTGCVTETTKVEKREDLLAASGFTIKPADTPKRQAMLTALPAHHFVQRSKNGKAIFLYADPLVCDCLYIGDDKAYSAYQSIVLEREMARDEGDDQAQLHRETRDDYNASIRASVLENNANWDWDLWGPGWW